MSTDAKTTTDNVVMMPDIYSGVTTAEAPLLEVVDLTVSDNDDFEEGFNPYDTGRLQKHKLKKSER